MKRIFKSILKWFFILLSIATIFLSNFYIFYIKGQIDINNIKKETKREVNYIKPTNIENLDIPKLETIDGITNILLLGADSRGGNDSGRTDSIMILTIDIVHNKVKLTSLLRDNLVEIPGYGKSKLNHAYSFGGVELLEDTIKKNYKIDINKYALVNFQGFKSIIDKIDGVEVDIKENELEELNKYIFDNPDENSLKIEKEGVQIINGTQALSYVRIRKGVGDEYGRTERQRALLNSAMNKFKGVSFTKYPSITNSLIENIDTNLNLSDILKIANTVLKIDMDNIETSYVPYTEISIGGEYEDYGWVFRTDLDLTSNLLNKYIYYDEKVDLNNINKDELNLIK